MEASFGVGDKERGTHTLSARHRRYPWPNTVNKGYERNRYPQQTDGRSESRLHLRIVDFHRRQNRAPATGRERSKTYRGLLEDGILP
jgi:hypothetical protein